VLKSAEKFGSEFYTEGVLMLKAFTLTLYAPLRVTICIAIVMCILVDGPG